MLRQESRLILLRIIYVKLKGLKDNPLTQVMKLCIDSNIWNFLRLCQITLFLLSEAPNSVRKHDYCSNKIYTNTAEITEFTGIHRATTIINMTYIIYTCYLNSTETKHVFLRNYFWIIGQDPRLILLRIISINNSNQSLKMTIYLRRMLQM